MKRLAVSFTSPCRVSVREEHLPPPDAGQVLIKTLVSAISPGTELLIYRGQAPTDVPLAASLSALAGPPGFPLKYGYSNVGRVTAAGAGINPEWEGRHVFSFHPHESHFLKPLNEVFPVPAGLSCEEAALLPNMETAVNFLMDGRPLLGEQVVVFGQGVVGLLTTALLSRTLPARLVTLDRYPLRRAKSLALGAHASLDPESPDAPARLDSLLHSEHSRGADLVYELSGDPTALDAAVAVAGFGGRVVVGSWYGQKRVELNLGGRFHRDRIRLMSSQVSTLAAEWTGRWTKARRLEVAWQMLRQVGPAQLITHRFPVERAAEAYALLDRHPEEAIQVLLTYED